MQISDREIKNSLRILAGTAFNQDTRAFPDPKVARELLPLIQGLPEIRREKVDTLKRAIREARYQVPSEDVARKLLGRLMADRLR